MLPEDATAVAPAATYRLPYAVEPQTYRLTLEPDLDTASFRGSVSIDCNVHETVSELVCNAAELTIETAEVLLADGRTLSAAVHLDEQRERAVFELPEPIGRGRVTLEARFAGMLNDRLRGFYRSTFSAGDERTHTIATTQMEATDARRAFPCWDEPDRKAVFEVTLVVADDLGAWSNAPVSEETLVGDGRRAVRFAPTMKMSTYLVAFVVGPLETSGPVDVDGVPVRIVHAPGKGHLATYPLEVAAHALRFYTEYFGIPYPGQKVDLVAIPDFAFGAMENLGCITFRETALLIDPTTAARTELERVADVVNHELAHMWFGDLVTMRWWEGIWLNEAFATFMEILCTDHFRPGWHRWDGFVLEREAALSVDGLHSTRPIEYPVGSPEEAEGMFDVLTYEKGASVLRMLEQYLGGEVFRDGVREYLGRHAYANTVTADLWDAIETVSGQPVRAVMDSWILQGGHPVVTLAGRTLAQEPFRYGPVPRGTQSAIGGPWRVPVLMRHLGDPSSDGAATTRILLSDASVDLPRKEDARGGQAVVLNAGGWGVYRVAYGEPELKNMRDKLGQLGALERANLFYDTWAQVLAGRAALGSFFALAACLGDEIEPGIWSAVVGALGLSDRIVSDGERPEVQAATRRLLGERAASLGWERRPDEDERAPTLRAQLITALGTIGHDEGVRAEAARRFEERRPGANGGALDGDLESAVLSVVADQLRPGDYDKVLDAYRHPATPQEEVRYLYALGDFPDAGLCERSFELALGEVRTQNAPFLVTRLLANKVGGPAVWQRVKDSWETLVERFPFNSHARMVEGVRTLCRDRELAADVTSFLSAHPVRSGQRQVTQTLERLAINVAFADRERARIAPALVPVTGE